jgi:hypothetical protein
MGNVFDDAIGGELGGPNSEMKEKWHVRKHLKDSTFG